MFVGVSGVRSRGMTPEVTQETGRRRTTSEGHDNRPMGHSPDFTNNLSLNPGARPREVEHHGPAVPAVFVFLLLTLCLSPVPGSHAQLPGGV